MPRITLLSLVFAPLVRPAIVAAQQRRPTGVLLIVWAMRLNVTFVMPRTALLLLLVAPLFASGADLLIRNQHLLVRCDSGSGAVTITRAIGVPLMTNVVLSQQSFRSAEVLAASDRTLGTGQYIVITRENGDRERISLFQDQPFALLRWEITNGGPEILVTNKVSAFSANIDYFKAGSSVKTFGTGGLLDPAKNPGSYAWLAFVNPQERDGLVFGWLTHDRGSGILFSGGAGDRLSVTGRVDYGHLRIHPAKTAVLESLLVGYFDDARFGLEQYADTVAKHYDIRLPAQPTGYCTWYSRPHGRAADQEHIVELAAFAKTNLAPFGFSVVQIDDGWQEGISTNGPDRNFTTHRRKGPYPDGMKGPADQIRALGLTPGLWFMPFAGTYYDPFFAGHQDWFARRANDGRPYETAWGGTCLDMTHPGARAHLSNVVQRITREWGYSYIKIDGLWTGTATKQQYINSGYREDNMGDAVLHDPDKTNIEAFRDGLKLLRQAMAPGTFVLACNGPQNMRSYGGAFGLVDGMRVGPDNGSGWKSLMRGPIWGSRHYFLHGRVWHNDPDPVYVRAEMPLKHAQLVCSWVAISGQMNLSSEWLPGLPQDRLDILKRTMPPHGLQARPVDLFENDPPRLWIVRNPGRAMYNEIVAAFNWTDEELEIDAPAGRLGLSPGQVLDVYDFWENRLVAPMSGTFKVKLAPQSCRVLSLRTRAAHPRLISTSRHVTQGIIDVVSEEWDSGARTLRGRSKVISGDPCELRIIDPAEVKSVSVSEADRADGVMASFAVEEKVLRVKIESPTTREVDWSIVFANP